MTTEKPDSAISSLDPECWVDEHGAALYRYALSHLRDPDRAEEMVQETLLAALEGIKQFSGKSSVRTWLVGILKHKVIDLFRREAREEQLDEPDDLDGGHDALEDSFLPDGHWKDKLATWGNPVEALERSQFARILQACMDRLPPKMARLFWLSEVMEEETENICKELALTPTNLWTTLYRARFGLRQCLDRNWAV